MAAGPELSVAATKTFIASLAAVLRLSAQWADDPKMLAALASDCPTAWMKPPSSIGARPLGPLAKANSLVAIGRGPTLAVAREAALKLKETCALHAEAFSSAEFRHGPIALVSSAYPLFVFAPADEAAYGFAEFVTDLRRKGASVLVAEAGAPNARPAACAGARSS